MQMVRSVFAALSAVLFVLSPAFAFETPLSDKTVREAYFLGQRHDASTEAALKPYQHNLPAPKSGPYIADIRVLTPFAQVLEASSSQSAGYSAQQAAADYHSHADTIVVRFHIEFTPSYGYIESSRDRADLAAEKGISIRTEDFWQAFNTGLSQNDQWIEPLTRDGEPIYARSEDSGGMIGAYIWVTYDAHDVSSDPAVAEIFTPDGQHVTSTFDLSTLR
ncbi:MAG: hypothetical protein NVS9B14_22410 [Candidatus Acidiferrum sp.]